MLLKNHTWSPIDGKKMRGGAKLSITKLIFLMYEFELYCVRVCADQLLVVAFAGV